MGGGGPNGGDDLADGSWLDQLHRTSLEDVGTQMASNAAQLVSMTSSISASLDQAEQLGSMPNLASLSRGDPACQLGSHPPPPQDSASTPSGLHAGGPPVAPGVRSASDWGTTGWASEAHGRNHAALAVRDIGVPRDEAGEAGGPQGDEGGAEGSINAARLTALTNSSTPNEPGPYSPGSVAGTSVAGTSVSTYEYIGGTGSSGAAGDVYGAVGLASAPHGLVHSSHGLGSAQSFASSTSGSAAPRSRLLTRPDHLRPGADGSSPPVKKWAAFISHYKVEAAMEARFLQTELEVLLGRKCFLDSDDLRDLRLLQQSVRESDCLILVQSKSVLSRPYCLLEMVTAIEARVPIVGVSLAVGGHEMYRFEQAPSFLAHLERTLEQANPGASSVLTRANVALGYASRLLASTIPEIISIQFNPSASRNMLAASVADVASAMESALPMRVPSPEAWSRQQAVTPVPAMDWNDSASRQRTSPASPTPSSSVWRAWPFRRNTSQNNWAAANGRN